MEDEKLGKMTFKDMTESIKTSDDLLGAVDDIIRLTKVVGKAASKLEVPETKDEINKALMSVFASLDNISSSYLNVVMGVYSTKGDEDETTDEDGDGKNAYDISVGKIDNADDALRAMNTLMNIFSGVLGVATEIIVIDDKKEVVEGVKDIFNSIEGITTMWNDISAKAREVDVRFKEFDDVEELIHHVFVLGRVVESQNARALRER